MQQIAEPGGIMISRPVFDQVRNKLSLGFDYLGDQKVKNVSDPVPSYRIRFADAPPTGQQPAAGAAKPQPLLGPATTPAELWASFRRLPALIRLAFVGVAFFFALNLASGLFPLWFHWPSIPMLAIILLYYSLRRPRDRAP
jgi:adenylate cyclase